MIPVVWINSRSVPYVDMIMNKQKPLETRSRNVLRILADSGTRFYIAETGKGLSMVRCSARIRSVIIVRSLDEWNKYRPFHCVPVGDPDYDWKPETKRKVLYELYDIRPVPVPFHPPEGKRHGITWMEYEGGF